MKEKIIPTKLDVFNMGDSLSFDVNTPQFLKEACENSEKGMYAVCWNIFKNLIVQVAERATELNDPILNTLMIRLNLYEIPNKERYKIIKQMKELYEASKKNKKKKDMELTWEDIRELHIIFADIDTDIELCKTDIKSETLGYYQEVLKRFKSKKGE